MQTQIHIDFNILSWNLNGIKRKFSSEYVHDILKKFDIVVISESHLNIRDKCPEEFMFIGRSKPIKSEKTRGGVALYRRMNSVIDFEIVSDELRDCVVFRLLPVDIVVAAMYIPPSNSKYHTPHYMENLQLLLSTFKDTPKYIVGRHEGSLWGAIEQKK